MTTTPCHDTFDRAQARRKQHPLTSGASKLRDACQGLAKDQQTMETIGDFLRHPKRYGVGQYLGGCTTDDKAQWLKRIPLNVAETLGHDILPAIRALTGDGVLAPEVEAELKSATSRAMSLLADCEEQHARMKAGIKYEYANIKNGYSEVYGLLSEAYSIASQALDIVSS